MMADYRLHIAAGGVLLLALVIAAWVYWPAPAPSPAEDALKQQIEELKRRNVELAEEAAAKTAEANDLREDANAKLEEIQPIRASRRAARRDGASRRDAILATPDERTADALRAQHERTRQRLRDVGADSEPATIDGSSSQPR